MSGSRSELAKPERFKNWEIAVLALFLQGGASKRIHTEDVALKCFELAPDAFSWIKYPNLPDKDIARVALTDARKPACGILVAGRAGRGRRISSSSKDPADDGWILSEAGAKWVSSNRSRLDAVISLRQVRFDRQDVLQHLSRLRNHRVFRTFQTNASAFSPSLGDLADLLRCRPDAPRRVWDQRLERLRNEALLAGQSDVLEFLTVCESVVGSTASS